MKKLTLILLLVLFWSAFAQAQPESYYQDKWCDAHLGETEVRTTWGTRVDCLIEDYAVEVDFDYKYYEGFTQALSYAMLTGRRAAVLLILTKGDYHLHRATLVRDHYGLPITIFTIEAE